MLPFDVDLFLTQFGVIEADLRETTAELYIAFIKKEKKLNACYRKYRQVQYLSVAEIDPDNL